MEHDKIIESIYQSNSGIKEHFILKILGLKSGTFFYMGIREDSRGKSLEPIILIMDELFTQAEKYGFLNYVF